MSPQSIGVTEVAFRDAYQSLMAARIAMGDMIGVCEEMDKAGFWSVECQGSATFDTCIRFLNEDPWERLRIFRKLVPNSRLQILLRDQNLLGHRHYGDMVADKFAKKSTENGMDVFRVSDTLNDPRDLEHAMRAVKNVDKHAQGTICYTASPLHNINGYVELADRLLDMGANSIALKDVAALLKPQPAYDIIRGIKGTYGEDTRISVHCHSTTGMMMVTLMKAIETDADVVDTAISSVPFGPGHNSAGSLVKMLEKTGYTTDLSVDSLITTRDHFRKVHPRRARLESKTLISTDIFMSQIPGGMLSNMENRLKAQDADDRVDEVMREVPIVHKNAGYPPLVTPSLQIVGTQAVFNVLMGRCEVMIAEFADLMLDYYDQCLDERNPELIKQAAEQAKKEEITVRPADLLEPEWDDLVEEAKEPGDYDDTAEGVLTNVLFSSVTPGFFTTRSEGPKNVSRTAERPKREAEQASDTANAIREPIRYKVTAGGCSQAVQVGPA